MPMLITTPTKEGCCRRRIKDYLDNEFGKSPGRALAWDYINLTDREAAHWDRVMDETRKSYGHDASRGGRASRQYYHIIVSPDPRDAVDLETLRELTTRWAAEMFGGPTEDDYESVGVLGDFQVAIAYHDDNTNRVPHAHLIVNASNLANGKKLWMSKDVGEKVMPERLQEIAAELGLSYFDDQGLSVLRTDRKIKNKSLTSAEKRLIKESKFSWKDELRSRIDIAKCISGTERDFINALDEMGIGVRQKKAGTDEWVYFDKRNPRYWECGGPKLGPEYMRTAIERYRRKLRGKYFATEAGAARITSERKNVLGAFRAGTGAAEEETAEEIIDRVAEQFGDRIARRTVITMRERVDVDDLAAALKTNRDYDVQCYEDYQLLLDSFERWTRLEGASLEGDSPNAIAYRRLIRARDIAEKGDLFAGVRPRPSLPRPVVQPKRDPLRSPSGGYKGSSGATRGRRRTGTQTRKRRNAR